MALFFDQPWFDQKLNDFGFDRSIAARALGLSPEQMEEVWKDQRELSAREVATLATLLQSEPAEVAKRAGVSTPVPGAAANTQSDLEEIKERLGRLEEAVSEIAVLLRAR